MFTAMLFRLAASLEDSGMMTQFAVWGAAGAASTCVGMVLALKFVDPLSYELIFADEDDPDAISNAIGQSLLDKFAVWVVINVLVNGAASAYFESGGSFWVCVASCLVVAGLSVHAKIQEARERAEEGAKHLD